MSCDVGEVTERLENEQSCVFMCVCVRFIHISWRHFNLFIVGYVFLLLCNRHSFKFTDLIFRIYELDE